MAVPLKKVGDGLFYRGLGHSEVVAGSGIVVVFTHHQLTHIASGELRAHTATPQQIAQPPRQA